MKTSSDNKGVRSTHSKCLSLQPEEFLKRGFCVKKSLPDLANLIPSLGVEVQQNNQSEDAQHLSLTVFSLSFVCARFSVYSCVYPKSMSNLFPNH